MAKGMDVVEKSLEDLEREITCAICQEHYTEPKVLPCLHCYCKQCILKLSLRTGTDKPFSCPECRKEAILPEGNVDNLLTAFTINRLKDAFASLERTHSKVEVKCELCTASEAKAEAFCRECAEFICNKCSKSHQRMKMFVGHEVVSLQDLKKGKAKRILPKRPPTSKCSVHDEPLTMYCFDCNCLICRDCTIMDHKEHRFDFCRIAAPKMKDKLIQKLDPLREVSNILSQALENIESTKEDVMAQGNSVASTVTISFDELHQILETRKQQLLEEAARKMREKIDNLSEQEKNMSIASAAVQSVIDYTEQCMSLCTDNEVMCMHAEIGKQIDREIEEHSKPGRSVEPVEEADIGVDVNCAEALKQLCQTNATITQLPIDPSKCTVIAEAKTAEVEKMSSHKIILNAKLSNGKPTKHNVTINSHLKSLVNNSIIKCTINQSAHDEQEYHIQYTPTVRGRHELTLSVNGQQVSGSPFPVFVSIPPTQLGQPVKVFNDVNTPLGLAVNSVGEVIVAEGEGDVVVLDKEWNELRRIKQSEHHFKDVQYMTVDSDDNIYFTDVESNLIYKSNKLCSNIQVYEVKQVDGPGHLGLAVFGDEMMVCERYNKGRIVVYDKELNYVREIIGIDMGSFYDLSPDKHGNLYVTDYDNDCIRVFSNDGELLRSFSRDSDGVEILSGASEICVAGQCVYVTDRCSDGLYVFTIEGEYVTSLGQYCDKFLPCGVHVDRDGFVYVCDYYNKIIIF